MNATRKSNTPLLAVLCLLAACATGQTGSFESATGETFSARSSPAKILPAGTKVDDAALLKLGELTAEVALRECYDGCRTIRETGNSTEALAREAADEGADIVVLLEDNVRVSNIIEKEECAESEIGSRQETFTYYEDGFRKTGTRSVPVTRCASYKTVYGKRHVLRSTGIIYRRGETKALQEQNRRQLIEQYVAANEYSGLAAALKADPGLADIRIADALDGFKYARAAVDTAVRGNAFNALKALLEAGADPNGWRNSESSLPPIHRALHTHYYFDMRDKPRAMGGLKCLELLLEYGADPNVFHDGFTPLHQAARYADLEGVQLLLRHGADESLLAKPRWRSGQDHLRDKTAYDIAKRGLRFSEMQLKLRSGGSAMVAYYKKMIPIRQKIMQLLKP